MIDKLVGFLIKPNMVPEQKRQQVKLSHRQKAFIRRSKKIKVDCSQKNA